MNKWSILESKQGQLVYFFIKQGYSIKAISMSDIKPVEFYYRYVESKAKSEPSSTDTNSDPQPSESNHDETNKASHFEGKGINLDIEIVHQLESILCFELLKSSQLRYQGNRKHLFTHKTESWRNIKQLSIKVYSCSHNNQKNLEWAIHAQTSAETKLNIDVSKISNANSEITSIVEI